MKASLLKLLFWMSLSVSVFCQADDDAPKPAKPGIILHADRAGHFGGQVLINNYSMPFLIDTGATITSIPMKLALAAHLPFGEQVEIHTPAGRTYDKTTQISSLKLGTVEIKNIKAHLNKHLEEVLIGMNTLKYFQVQQSADTMILSVDSNSLLNNDGVSIGEIDEQSRKNPSIASKPISKSVDCDAQKHCITRYGN